MSILSKENIEKLSLSYSSKSQMDYKIKFIKKHLLLKSDMEDLLTFSDEKINKIYEQIIEELT